MQQAIGFVCHPVQHTICTRQYKQCNPVVGPCVAILSYFPLLLLAALFLVFLPEKFHNTHLSHLLSYCHNQGCVLSIFGDQPAFSVLTPFTGCGKRWWGVFAKLFSLFKLSCSHKARWVIVQRWGFPSCVCVCVHVDTSLCAKERDLV